MTPLALALPPFRVLSGLPGAAIAAWSFAIGFLDGYMLARIFG